MSKYGLTVKTLTPLHIGTGNILKNKYEFISENGKMARLNIDAILDDNVDKILNTRSFSGEPGSLINSIQGNERYFRYIASFVPQSDKSVNQIRECVKDVFDLPYIPGSSIKGAIRTAIGDFLLRSSGMKPYYELKDKRNKKTMDDDINKELFGQDSFEDVFRTLQISDLNLDKKASNTLQIRTVAPYSKRAGKRSVSISLECVASETVFRGTLKIDDYLCKSMPSKKTDPISRSLMKIIKEYSSTRTNLLKYWYGNAFSAEKLSNFFNNIQTESEQFSENQALLQIGYGTGWDGMTYSSWLKSDKRFFRNFRRYTLKEKGSLYLNDENATDFPTTRKVALDASKPTDPLGWVLLTLEPKA